MVEHIGEHLLIGCNIAIPRVKKGENLLSLEVKMEKNPALPLSQTRPCCSSPSQVSHCRWFLFAHALLAHFLCYHGTDRLGWRRGREKGFGAASVRLGSFDILEGDTPRSLFFYFQECVGVCFTEVSPGHVRLIEVRFVQDGSIQVCSTQISIAEICSLQVCAAEVGTTYICSVEACHQEISIAQIGTP